MEELLSLKWNNHRSTFLHILSVLRDKQAYTDVTLACDGKFYSVHKLVLSTCSDYFCAMFEKTSCKSPVIVLKDIKSEDLEALLDYMYLGEVNVRQSDLASLIKAAENLRIKGLAVPDDEPPSKKSASGGSVGAPSRRDGGSGSPPTKRKRRDESEDGREDVRPSGGELNTPPPSRPKSPGIQRLSPSPHRTSQEPHAVEDRDNRPLSSPAEASSHVQSSNQLTQQSAQQIGEQVSQTMGNQFRAEDTPYVKVELPDDEGDGANRDSFNISSDSFKEETDVGDLSNDLPEFLQQAASSALAGTSGSYHQSFAGPSGFQSEVSSWHGGDSQSLPGNFPGMGFPPSSQENPPGIGAELHGNVCKVCGKVFNGRNWKQNLEYHFLTHTKEKPYKCPICPHSSALKYNLIRHIRNRHWELLAPSVLNASGEREATSESRNPVLLNREVNAVLSQEMQQQQLSADRLDMSQLTATGHGNQNQQDNQLNLNQNFQIALTSSQETQMSSNSNSQAVHIASSSGNQVAPLVTAAATVAGNDNTSSSNSHSQLSQMVAAAASVLTPLNFGPDIPISSNQEMQVPVNREVQSSSVASQGTALLSKDENPMLMK